MLEREDQDLLNNRLEEEAAEMLDGFDKLLAFELGRVESLGFDSNGVGGICSDGLVVRWKWDGKTVEGVVVFGSVLDVVVQKVREAVGAARDIDGLNEVGKDIDDVFCAVVSRQ